MADIHDYMESARNTDSALSSARTYGAQLEDEHKSENVALATLLAADAIACAIREASTRLDYVLRDIEQSYYVLRDIEQRRR